MINKKTNKVTILIDGVAHQVDASTNLLQACLAAKMDIPYFCWHPALGSAGACRQCAVIQYQNAEDTRGRLVMACMTPVTEGMIVSMADDKAHTFRATTIAALMTNHPHDCPVCEEGGDCHLQDMTLISGHISRQYPGTKRTHMNQYLGPLLNHEMNRCIGCYRCVRFYRDYCGGDDLNVFSSRNQVYFGRAESGDLENEFSGNLAEVCPTGVFTDKPYSQHFTRKWDLQTAPTICSQCSVGCNTYTAERGGVLRKITNRYNRQINAHFLCDRGRFGYDYINHSERLEKPWQRDNEARKVAVVTTKIAEHLLTEWFSDGNTVVVGSGRSGLENNAALCKLAGDKHFYAGISDEELAQLRLLAKTYHESDLAVLSLEQLENCDALLLVGEDLTHTAPRVALSIRQMTRNAGLAKAAKLGIKDWQDEAVRNIAQDLRSPLHIINSYGTRLADVAKANLYLSPVKQFALLLEIEALLTDPNDKDIASAAAVSIVEDLLAAARPALVTGTNSSHPSILAACLRIGLLLQRHNAASGFYCATRQANSLALGILCLADHGLNALQQRLKTKPPRTLVVMETDLYRYFDADQLDALLDKVQHIVVLDQVLTRTAKMADLVLPVGSYAESHNCWISAEGRLQRSYAVMPAIKSRFASFQWLQSLSGFHTNSQVLQWCADTFAALEPLQQWLDAELDEQHEFVIARQSQRAASRTAINAGKQVKEYPPAQDRGTQLQFSMEGVPAYRQQQLAGITSPPTGIWSPKWNSGQGVNKSLDQQINTEIKLFQTHPAVNSSALAATDHTISSDGVAICVKHHIYADDELAAYMTALQALIPQPQAFLSAEHAASLGLQAGDHLSFKGQGISISLPWVIESDIAPGVVLIPLAQFVLLGTKATLASPSRSTL